MYIEITKRLRKVKTQLFVSTVIPFHRICKQTVANWIRTVLCKSGIDVKQFSPQSARSAAVCAAKQCNVPIDVILKSAGLASDCVFRKFYQKDIITHESMGEILLKKAKNSCTFNVVNIKYVYIENKMFCFLTI